MSKPILSYWDIRGVAEPIRLLLHLAKVDFVDNRYTDRAVWFDKDKPALDVPFPNLPNWVDGDFKLTESLAILRYLARKHGLVGKTEEDQVRVDLAEQVGIDYRQRLIRMAFAEVGFEEKRDQRKQAIPNELEQFEKFLGSRKFIAGDYVTYSDLIFHEVLDYFKLFSPEAFEGRTVTNSYLDRIKALPGVKEYLTSPTYNAQPLPPFAKWSGAK